MCVADGGWWMAGVDCGVAVQPPHETLRSATAPFGHLWNVSNAQAVSHLLFWLFFFMGTTRGFPGLLAIRRLTLEPSILMLFIVMPFGLAFVGF